VRLPFSIVALVGLRAAGKTTLGRALAGVLDWPFVDGDERLAAAVGQPAGEWLAAVGEAVFRRREAEILLLLLHGEGPLVLATGGGAVTIPEVREALGGPRVCSVWLDAPVAVLLSRQLGSAVRRPPLTRLPPAAEVDALAAQRASLYGSVARLRIDTSERPAIELARDLAARIAAIGPRGPVD
jgi:shikimate kinase